MADEQTRSSKPPLRSVAATKKDASEKSPSGASAGGSQTSTAAVNAGTSFDLYNTAGSNLLQFPRQSFMMNVGELSDDNKDTLIQVGDVVYFTLTFPTPLTGQGKPPTDYNGYFRFVTDRDGKELNLTIKSIDPNFQPTGQTTGRYTKLTYLLDFENFDSGENKINLLGNKDDVPVSVLSDLLATSSAFYVQQSPLSQMQSNISGSSLDTGLARESVGYPDYLPVGLQPVNPLVTDDVSLWTAIRNGTNALSFKNYSSYMDYLFCGGTNPFTNGGEDSSYNKLRSLSDKRFLPFTNTDAYRSIKVATEAFVMVNLEVAGQPDEQYEEAYSRYLEAVSTNNNGDYVNIIPYLAVIRRKLSDVDFKTTTIDSALDTYLETHQAVTDSCYGLISSKLQMPCFLELIWNYWHEESMMVQGLNAICRRFQNIRGKGAIDPLANIEVGPLRPLNNLLWGYIQDEQHRLTVRRRAYEYDHHYGISLNGKAVEGMKTADSRSKFIEAFHVLLNTCMKFYKQYDDTTVVADGFPVLNALKEVHLILSEGAHNQYGDLPSTARIEMLMQQYILARPEFREFLPTRQMVPYPEAWMDRTAVLNNICGWTKTNVMHYHDLGVFGEQILLAVRFGNWSDVFNRDQAANWAIFWRPQIQNYMHAYRTVTGVDLTREDVDVDIQQPTVHLVRRLREQNRSVAAV